MSSTFYKGVPVISYEVPGAGGNTHYRAKLGAKWHRYNSRAAMEKAVSKWVNQQIKRDIKKNPAVKRHFER